MGAKAVAIFVLSLVSQLQFAFAARAVCYYPNGKVSTGDYPCNPNDANSPCCGGGLGNVCLANNLCRSTSGNVIRGSCTNQNWDGCANYCLDASTGGTDLISCSNVTRTDTSYCCDHTTNCCDTGVGRFEVLPSSPAISASWVPSLTQYVVVSTSSTSSAQSSTTSGSASTQTTSAGSAGATTSSTSAAAAAGTTSPQSDTSSDSSGLSTGAKAGIGAGIGGGVLLLAALAFVLMRLRKANKQLQERKAAEQPPTSPEKPPEMDSSYYTGTTYTGTPYTAPVEIDSRNLGVHELPPDNMRPGELPDHSQYSQYR